MTHIERINFLLEQLDDKLKNTLSLREKNLEKIQKLFKTLRLDKKHANFTSIFNYQAINLAGIGLKNEDFGEIREGKYVQIIAIASEINNNGEKIIKNLSLGYYGKAEKLSQKEKGNIIEFVLRWRYEKTFQHSDYYQQLLEKLH
ncbi:MAG: Unknown protein [uncultured Sulfurovum sp.]|uniref:Uncharacterized protein n=1 Tax=uncultured Sulfurovum sp. TaxID=269237 RepID=A0A6S6S9F4_9BACT|nr:MAG: Unknown protein [uncultured Sulfurovum sp.]